MKDNVPLMNEAGRRRLRWLTEHRHAPRYTHPGFNRMSAAGMRCAREFADEIRGAPPRWAPGRPSAWLEEFVARCFRDVPFYRAYGDRPANFFDIPTTDRADLGRAPWAFVPDSQPLDELIVYNTSGATGHPLDVLTHPDTLALYVPLMQRALELHGLALEGGAESTAIAYVCFQKQTYTYATVMPALDQAGFVKINLNPAEWRDPADRAQFLDECAPQIYTGTPVAFAELAALPLTAPPRALLSTSMALTPGLRHSLEARFGCPVLDVYSLNESGPVAVKARPQRDTKEHEEAYQLLQPRLYVEILDDEGAPCPPGARGEITLTGGFNPFLPLLRYRTGDTAALEWRGGPPALAGLEGRPPVVFRARDGRAINNVDVSQALRGLPIPQFSLYQSAEGALWLRVRGADDLRELMRAALLALFGADQPLTVEPLGQGGLTGGQQIQYTSDMA